MALHKFTYELFNGRTLHVGYYTDVKNSAALRQGLVDKAFDAALLNAQLIVAPFQIHAAASRALLCDATGKLTARSLHAELVFNMSGSRNVSESFRRFGVNDACTSLALCVFDADEDALAAATALVDGTLRPVDELGSRLQPEDVMLLKKFYKIQDQELTCSSLVDAVACRIATKSCNK